MNQERKDLFLRLYRDHNRPFYFYDEAVIVAQADRLLHELEGFEILYSVKTNPHPPIARFLFSKGIGADAASANEALLAHEMGVPVTNNFYSAPGKTRADLERSIDKAVIIADSYHELELADAVSAHAGRHTRVGVRINPDFTMDGKGVSGKFGIDAESVPQNLEWLRGLANITIAGIHVHVRSQVLDAETLERYYKNVLQLAETCQKEWGWELDFINFGGGLGIPYERTDVPLDIRGLGAACAAMRADFSRRFGARLLVESGRYLVGAAGKFVTPVVDIKESRKKKYLIVQNSLNGFLRPSAAELLRTVPEGKLRGFSAEPLYTTKDAFAIELIGEDNAPAEMVDIVGNLCTANDAMARNIILPRARIGDLLVFSNAGSYGYTLSPILFSSHDAPLQIHWDLDGKMQVAGL